VIGQFSHDGIVKFVISHFYLAAFDPSTVSQIVSHNIVKVAVDHRGESRVDNIVTKFIVNNWTDAVKTGVKFAR